ncbi:MAG: hypothetical protein ACI8P3_002347 [Saprospiraceae bacterium]|jgi:hypothetical protein
MLILKKTAILTPILGFQFFFNIKLQKKISIDASILMAYKIY